VTSTPDTRSPLERTLMSTEGGPETTQLNVDRLRLPIRRCRLCESWMGAVAVSRHQCHEDDPIIDAILSEYSRIEQASR
jgi:hypothetical protein